MFIYKITFLPRQGICIYLLNMPNNKARNYVRSELGIKINLGGILLKKILGSHKNKSKFNFGSQKNFLA